MIPLLDREAFERDYRAARWRTELSFAKVCLLVFANGSKIDVNDPEVYWPPRQPKDRTWKTGSTQGPEIHTQSAGWRYLQLALRLGRPLLAIPRLHDRQCQAVSAAEMNRR